VDALALYRVGRWCRVHKVPLVPRFMQAVGMVVFSAVVPSEAQIGDESMLAYGGLGVVIHKRAVVGNNVLISPGVIIGGRSHSDGVPRIGDDVFIGGGAKVLGDLEIGGGSVIGANAVVLKSVPPRCVVAGVPARVIRTDIDVLDYCRLPRDLRADRRHSSSGG
jgi:serine O-acetyltransferase